MSGVREVVGILQKCRKVFFITGAGLSADSGLPTYRGVAGLYDGKMTEDGVPIETALSGEMLIERPEVVWKHLLRIDQRCRWATFNRGHRVIAEMEEHFEKVVVLTQNIDGFHQAAGSGRVIDIHGDIHHMLCRECEWQDSVDDLTDVEVPPSCPVCASTVRPGVVFFGEQLPPAKTHQLYEELREGFDIYFSVGTSSLFPYIQEPILQARANSLPTVEINPADTAISDMVDVRIKKGAAETLAEIWEAFSGDHGLE